MIFGSAVATGAVLVQPAAAAPPLSVKVVTTYTAPVSGEDSVTVKALQTRLAAEQVLARKDVTAYFGPLTTDAVKKFQRQHHLKATGKVDGRTWSALVKASGTLTTTTSSRVRSLPQDCRVDGRVLCADKTTRKLYYLVDGNLVRTLDARFGCTSGGRATREGTFRIYRKNRHWVSTIFHTPMPYSMFFSGGQAVHFSADFAKRGYRGCSHGCVNIRSMSGISYLFSKMRVGDRVVVYRG